MRDSEEGILHNSGKDDSTYYCCCCCCYYWKRGCGNDAAEISEMVGKIEVGRSCFEAILGEMIKSVAFCTCGGLAGYKG